MEAVNQIAELQQTVLDRIARRIEETVQLFLPSIRTVSLRSTGGSRFRVSQRDIEINIDDGTLTSLDRKGDGVQSLVALALLRDAEAHNQPDVDSIIAIEEPESHLHPKAIREIKSIVSNLSQSSQVIVSTHSPIFVRTDDIASNIIVNNRKAQSADNINQLREALGVNLSDNLSGAECVLLVKGTSDKRICRSVLEDRSDRIREFFDNSRLTIDTLGGASNLSYKKWIIYK